MENKLQTTQGKLKTCFGCVLLAIIGIFLVSLFISNYIKKNIALITPSVPTTSVSLTPTQTTIPTITTNPVEYGVKIQKVMQLMNEGNSYVLSAISNVQVGDRTAALANVTQGETNFSNASSLLKSINSPGTYLHIHTLVTQALMDYQDGTSIMKQGALSNNISYASQGYAQYKLGTQLLNQAQSEFNGISSAK